MHHSSTVASQASEEELDGVTAAASVSESELDASGPATASAVSTPDTIHATPDLRAAKNALKAQLGGSVAIAAAAARAWGATTGAASNTIGLENIRGIGIGFRMTAGRLLPELAIKVLVLQKYAMSELAPSARILPDVDGVPVDIEEIGLVKALAGPNFWGRYPRPNIPCGVSCSNPATNEAGTIGAVVEAMVPKTFGGPEELQLCILSNNHVFVRRNQGTFGDRIVQPGYPTIDVTSPDRTIGLLSKWKSFQAFGNVVDGALARTNMPRMSASHVTYKLNPTPLTHAFGQTVRKDGMMSGSTMGTVRMSELDAFPVDYSAMGMGTFVFDNVLQIDSADNQPFAKLGDSGSLVVTAGSRQPVGLLFAANEGLRMGFANPIQDVMSQLGIVRFVQPT